MELFKSLSGMVDAELTSADIPDTLAAVSNEGIILHEIRPQSDLTVHLRISRTDYKKLKNLCEKRGASLRIRHRRGLYWTGKALLRRPVLLIGMVFLFAMISFVPSRVFFVEVEGNADIPSRLILEAAEECGIGFGASRREVRSERMKNALLQAVPELQWAGVNTYGCVAVISVRERSVTSQPETETGVCSIVAIREGIVTECTATRGTLLCQPGQAVVEGQTLISGYTDCGLTIQVTRAEGEVYAQTQREITAVMPSEYQNKGRTQEVKKTYSLIIGKKRINLWKDSGIWDTTCGRIYEENYITLPGGFQLPMALAVEEYTVCDLVDKTLEERYASEWMETFADAYVTGQMVAGTIQSREESVSAEAGFYLLEGEYVCTEMIGKVQREQIGEYNGENG